MSHRAARWLGAALAVGAAALATWPLVARLARSWRHRIAVEGHSMQPTLRAGDWLLVDPNDYRRRPRAGDLVVARDPREGSRMIVKRVAESAGNGEITLVGDHPAHADDRIVVQPGQRNPLHGRPWFRYWPIGRIGRVR